jgi:uncharacterized membrane protein YphA (DoxX/SURF4 family)
MNNTAKIVLRLGLAFVFFYFGISQLQNPTPWTGFIPEWLVKTDAAKLQFVYINGLFEVVCASLLVLGAYVRIAALLLALHLFGIAFTIGLSPIGVRDIGLAIATLTLSMLGAGSLSIDAVAKRKAVQSQ